MNFHNPLKSLTGLIHFTSLSYQLTSIFFFFNLCLKSQPLFSREQNNIKDLWYSFLKVLYHKYISNNCKMLTQGESAFWNSKLYHHLKCWHPISWLVQVLVTPFTIQLSGNIQRKQQSMAQGQLIEIHALYFTLPTLSLWSLWEEWTSWWTRFLSLPTQLLVLTLIPSLK